MRNLYESLKSVLGIEPIKCPPDNYFCDKCNDPIEARYKDCYNNKFMKNLRNYAPPKAAEAMERLKKLTSFVYLNRIQSSNDEVD